LQRCGAPKTLKAGSASWKENFTIQIPNQACALNTNCTQNRQIRFNLRSDTLRPVLRSQKNFLNTAYVHRRVPTAPYQFTVDDSGHQDYHRLETYSKQTHRQEQKFIKIPFGGTIRDVSYLVSIKTKQAGPSHRQNFWFVFGRRLVRMPVRTPAILTKVARGYPQSLQANAGVLHTVHQGYLLPEL